ncbi:hypothetical protein N7497_001106 [Penicillium chrysogenum]|nr:hypothetical protein N7497_001106 [Penicillium chrysogenum]
MYSRAAALTSWPADRGPTPETATRQIYSRRMLTRGYKATLRPQSAFSGGASEYLAESLLWRLGRRAVGLLLDRDKTDLQP